MEPVVVKLDCTGSTLSYTLSWKGKTLLNPSALSLIKNPDYRVIGAETKKIDKRWHPVWGQFSELLSHHLVAVKI